MDQKATEPDAGRGFERLDASFSNAGRTIRARGGLTMERDKKRLQEILEALYLLFVSLVSIEY